MLMDEIRIPAKDGRVIRIDSSDSWLLADKWYVVDKPNGYMQVANFKGSMPRAIMKPDKGVYVDHVNGNPLDNRRENLRLCSPAQNSRNRKGYGKHPYKGILTVKDSKKFFAQISKDGKKYALGGYSSIEDAALAYDKAAKELFGEYARLNFPEENKND